MTGLQLERLGAALGMNEEQVRGLVRFRDKLVARAIAEARPDP
jgi:hypothetical protein